MRILYYIIVRHAYGRAYGLSRVDYCVTHAAESSGWAGSAAGVCHFELRAYLPREFKAPELFLLLSRSLPAAAAADALAALSISRRRVPYIN